MDYSKINDIVIDFDGCLTSGKLSITADGSELFKEVHSRDSRALRELVARGYNVTIMTASDSQIIKAYCKKIGVDLMVTRAKLFHKPYIAIGDDSWDILLLANAEAAFCPADAYFKAKQVKDITVLQTKGGEGVIAELLDIINESISNNTKLDKSTRRA